LDEVESVLKIKTAPVTWPIGMGRDLRGIYHLLEDRIYAYEAAERGRAGNNRTIEKLTSDEAREFLGDGWQAFVDEVELVAGATERFDPEAYRAGIQTPVFFGSAISNFGVEELLAFFVTHAPAPLARHTDRAHPDRVCVQDSGEHGPAASRSHRFHATVFGSLSTRYAAVSLASRQGSACGRCADLHGSRPRAS
jgi:peptide subunit release factor RF-3